MATHNLTDQFEGAQGRINLGARARVAQAAHLEVRAVLRAAAPLIARGLHDVLIGSYARDTGIWPGKDVDVFGKLTEETIHTISPEVAYELFLAALRSRYQGRLTEQPRSIKVDFGIGDRAPRREFLEARQASRADVFEFSVDVVPAVRWDQRWAIPKRDRQLWLREAATDRWVRTDPEALNEETIRRNTDVLIGDQGAFVPTVKAVKQIRRHHLADYRPGGLFFEFALHEVCRADLITGGSWADVTAAALADLAERLRSADAEPVCDPVLGQPYQPAPTPAQLAAASATFEHLAALAAGALSADKCPAAAAWREVFGTNGNGSTDAVFPLPPGCRADGTVMPLAVAANPLRGSDEARGFGGR